METAYIKVDIYDIVNKFLDEFYRRRELGQYSMIKLTFVHKLGIKDAFTTETHRSALKEIQMAVEIDCYNQ